MSANNHEIKTHKPKEIMVLSKNKEYKLENGEVIIYKGVFVESRLSSLTLHEFRRKSGAPYTITLNKLLSWILNG
jgi:hypothetical protein